MIIGALSLGLSTGLFCLGYCYPLLAPVMLARNNGAFRQSARSLSLFLLGRLSAYLIVGFLVGVLGQRFQGSLFLTTGMIPVVYSLMGIVMILYGVLPSLPKWRLCLTGKRFFHGRRFLLLLGFFAGIQICPPFILALSNGLSLGSVIGSVCFFLLFFLSTSVYFLPFLASNLMSRFGNVRFAARVTSIFAGGWFIYLALRSVAFPP